MKALAAAVAMAPLLWCALPLGEASGQARSRSVERLDRGPADMQMTLEKTFLGIDVATVEIWFGGETRQRLQRLAAGRGYSDDLANRVAATAVAADDAVVRLEFKRDVSLSRFLDGVRDNLERAERSGLIDGAALQQGWNRVNRAFKPFARRGFRDGDQIVYRARPSSLRTTVASADGRVLLDTRVDDPSARRNMLAGYFAPGSDFREPLIRSLLR